ncbi:MFS transporter, partial [Myxococcota bacterium]|nr:MFS transporter [Myxococcota bacterium]
MGFLGHFFAVGCTLSVYGIFIEPVAHSFGAPMALASLGITGWQITNGVASPFLGRALQRLSIRRIMAAGAVLLGTGLAAASRAPDILTVGLIFSLWAAPGAILVGALPSSTLVSNWFVATRGRALGIAAAGTTGASMFFPPLAAALIDSVGWRDALLCLSIGATAVALPAVWWLVVDRPEDVGEHPDGNPAPAENASEETQTAPPIGSLLRDRNLWLVGGAFGLLFVPGVVSMLFMVPFARQLGLSLQTAALVMSLRAVAGVVG